MRQVAAIVGGGALAGMSIEGKMGDGRELLPAQKGPARIALSARAPVVPVGVWGTQERWPREGFRFGTPLRPTLRVVFGLPIPAEGDPRSRTDVRAVTDRIMSSLVRLVAQAQQGAPGTVGGTG